MCSCNQGRTAACPQTINQPCRSAAPDVSNAELVMMTVSEIVKQLIIAHKEKRDVNLNK